MSKHDDGGAAFPVGNTYTDRHGDIVTEHICGMTLRDYMAIHASDADVLQAINWEEVGSYPTPEQRAAARYRHARAMLAARGEHDGR